MDAKNKGWISLHRGIWEHWIWKDPSKFQWWIDILLSVNHSEVKVNIGYDLITCQRGQSVMSLSSWGKRWGVHKDTARNFLKLLEKDGMIILENVSKSTRLTVCNYDTYQVGLHDAPTMGQPMNQRNTNTNNNVNNDNNENKVIKKSLEERKKDFALALQPFVEKYGRDMINKFYKHWTAHNPNDRKMAFELSKTGKFYIANRLATWKQNESKFNSPKQQTQTTSKIETVLNAFEDVSKLYQ